MIGPADPHADAAVLHRVLGHVAEAVLLVAEEAVAALRLDEVEVEVAVVVVVPPGGGASGVVERGGRGVGESRGAVVAEEPAPGHPQAGQVEVEIAVVVIVGPGCGPPGAGFSDRRERLRREGAAVVPQQPADAQVDDQQVGIAVPIEVGPARVPRVERIGELPRRGVHEAALAVVADEQVERAARAREKDVKVAVAVVVGPGGFVHAGGFGQRAAGDLREAAAVVPVEQDPAAEVHYTQVGIGVPVDVGPGSRNREQAVAHRRRRDVGEEAGGVLEQRFRGVDRRQEEVGAAGPVEVGPTDRAGGGGAQRLGGGVGPKGPREVRGAASVVEKHPDAA